MRKLDCGSGTQLLLFLNVAPPGLRPPPSDCDP
jgi:hypothetical protein